MFYKVIQEIICNHFTSFQSGKTYTASFKAVDLNLIVINIEFNVKVININDNPPIFKKEFSYTTTIDEV